MKRTKINTMLACELTDEKEIIKRYSETVTSWVMLEFNKYLTDRKGNEEELTKLFNITKGLLKAPTGSGKTYSLIEIAKKVAVKTGRRIIFAVPKKKQAEQIGKEYKIPCVTGATKKIEEEGNVITCVYDSLGKVFKLKEWAIDDRTTVICDECHRLRYDINFRTRAIHGIKKIIKDTNYIFISATTRIIEDVEFEYKIECKTEKVNYNYDLCYICDYDGTLINSVLEVINLINAGKKHKILLFIENKDTLQKLKKYLEEVYNYKVAVLTSETKEEEAMQGLVNNSVLEGYEIYLATSVIEEGINIKNKNKFVCIYTVDSLNPSYDSLEQACARLRTEGHTSIIMRKNNDTAPNIDTLTKDVDMTFEELERKIVNVNMIYEMYKTNDLYKDNKSFMDSISIGRYIYFNDETEFWEADKDKFLRFTELQKEKEIAKNKFLHESQVRARVKAKEFAYLNLTTNKDDPTNERYKEISKEFNEEKQQEIDNLIESITNMREEARACLYEALYSNTIGREGSTLKEEEKQLITTIRGHKEVSKLLKEIIKYKVNVENQTIEINGDYKTLRRNTKLAKYKRYNAIALSSITDIIGFEDEELTHYMKLRKILDTKEETILNNEILLKVYKIKNPHHKGKGKDLTQRQKNSVFKFISEVYFACQKTNGQIKIGKLILE